ncbi:MAG: hypothetical protein K1000chlam3_00465 [Chlamydiae bacterium]|nr:hypothetical protein [Chlamydiota bacterium]
MRYLLPCLLFLFSSCSNYRSNFDCPAYSGAGCKSVSQIEAMIVENEQGSDCFMGTCPRSCNKVQCSKHSKFAKQKAQARGKAKAWVCPHFNSNRHYVEGHYIYFDIDQVGPKNEEAEK